MLVYLILLYISLISLSVERVSLQRQIASGDVLTNRCCSLTTILVILVTMICSMRGVNVGVDTSHYYVMFDEGSSGREPTFALFSAIASLFGHNFQIVILLYALFTVIPLFAFIRRESVCAAFSMLIYISFSDFFFPEIFNTIRECAAISWFLLSLSYYKAGSKKKSYVMMLASVMFHYSALIIWAIVLCSRIVKRLPQKFVIALVGGSMVFGILFKNGFTELSKGIAMYLSMSSSADLQYYSQHFYDLLESNFSLIGSLAQILPMSVFAVLMSGRKYESDLYYKLFVIGVVMTNVLVSVELIYRVTMFFTILIIVLLPDFYFTCEKGLKKRMLLYMTVLMCLWFVFRLLTAKGQAMAGIVPYEFFFSNQDII